MLSNLFLMLRHGPTKLNQSDEYRGWSNGPDAELNNDGLWAAREAASFLTNYKFPIKKVICSDLSRAMHTAQIVASINGIPEIEIDIRLKPLNVGRLAGKKKSENPIDKYLANKSKKFPGGESVNEFEARQQDIAAEILLKINTGVYNPGELLLVCHVSNVMFWHNLQSGLVHEDYLQESTDIIMPGGMVIVTDTAVLPILKWNPEAFEHDISKEVEGESKEPKEKE